MPSHPEPPSPKNAEQVDVSELASALVPLVADALSDANPSSQDKTVWLLAARNLLVDALSSLPAQTRAVLALRYDEGLRHPQIADVLHLDESRIRQLDHHAMTELRAFLKRAASQRR